MIMNRSLLIAFLCLVLLAPALVIADDDRASGEIKPSPWSGDWWSRKKGFLVHGWPGHQPSPLARYDQFVMAKTGKNPGALDWEANVANAHCNPQAQDWEGHCNGWSAAAMLEPEPRESRTRLGITFETADQKAILSEMYMNTYCNFYGQRYWNNSCDKEDLYPQEFHRLLLEFIGKGKSAMVADVNWDEQVWNFPIYKFDSSWGTGWFNDRKLKVKTTAYFADDGVRPDHIGTKWFSTTYTYNLFLDDQDNIIGGEWSGGSSNNHPDFVWVPTADAPNPPGTNQENPRLDPKLVHEITQGPAVVGPRDTSMDPNMAIMEAGLNPADLF